MLRNLVLPSMIFCLTLGLSAQTQSGGGRNPSGSPNISSGTLSDNRPRSFFLSGKVMVDDGTLLSDPVAIQSTCRGSTHTEAFTDDKGRFSFEVTGLNQTGIAADQATESSQTLVGRSPWETGQGVSDPGRLRDYWRACKLQAVLPGFTSDAVELAEKLSGLGIGDVGTIMLHRLAQVEGLTISVTSAQAPSKAKKEYEKGRELEKKEKWDSALESFQKAVELYPDYAIAWCEMGRVQVQKGDATGARQSFGRALSVDSKFVSPYEELAQLAARDHQWQEVVATTDQLLKLNPVSFPQDWLLSAVGNFYLQNLDAAEKSARRGLELDTQHQIPKLEYLLGLVLAQKQNYAEALQHMRNYLRLSPHAANAETAQKQVDELERLSAKTTADK